MSDQPLPGYIAEGTKIDPKIARIDFMAAIMNYGRRIISQNGVVNATTTLYTCPVGKIFYLTSLNIGFASVPPVTSSSRASMILEGNGSQNLVVLDVPQATSHNAIAEAFYPAFVIREKERIDIDSNSTELSVSGLIIGYEMDLNLIPQFI